MRKLRSERGDIIVTPAIILAGVATTLLLGALAFVATRSVAPGVQSSRQGLEVDDTGDVVSAGIGVAPVATATPKPTPEPTDAPVVRQPQQPTHTQQPQQTQGGTVIVVTPTEDPGHVDEGDEHSSNTTETDSGHEEEPCCTQAPHPN